MAQSTVQFYNLLPEFIRTADADQNLQLQALLTAAQSQNDLLYTDIQGLWDNFFVETCQPWVLPYIADLIGVNVIADNAADTRRDVGRTIAYRRHKGTVPLLEVLGRDVTGYDCRVFEFFQRIVWNQNMIHFRMRDLGTANVRDAGAMARVGTAFDPTAHTADVRPATQQQGLYNIPKIGFFLWRIPPIPLTGVEAAPAGPAGAFHFNVLGQPAPLFQSPAPLEHGTDQDWPRIDELQVHSPISPRVFLESTAQIAQQSTGFTIYKNGAAISAPIVAADLCQWTPPAANSVAVDVRLGRILFGTAPASTDLIQTDHYFGLPGLIGGGGYDRSQSVAPTAAQFSETTVVPVSKTGANPTIQDGLTAVATSTSKFWVVQIEDSRSYSDPVTLPSNVPTGTQLVIQGASGQRPVIVLSLGAAFTAGTGTQCQRLTLGGLLFTGAGQTLTLPNNIPEYLFKDCTVDPGGGFASDGKTLRPAGVTVAVPPPALGVSLHFIRCIAGALKLPEAMDCLKVTDSILDAQSFTPPRILDAGPPAVVVRSTLLGSFHCYRLDASESIFADLVQVLRQQEGCARFSSFLNGSRLPRCYECVSAPAAPPFTSRWFGQPAYTQLALSCPTTVSQGAVNGSEMGVWNSLGGPARMAHLQLRLAEYMPAGLMPVFVFVT